MLISIVIPIFNEEALLQESNDALVSETNQPSFQFELFELTMAARPIPGGDLSRGAGTGTNFG